MASVSLARSRLPPPEDRADTVVTQTARLRSDRAFSPGFCRTIGARVPFRTIVAVAPPNHPDAWHSSGELADKVSMTVTTTRSFSIR
jgi:hypothetical protein